MPARLTWAGIAARTRPSARILLCVAAIDQRVVIVKKDGSAGQEIQQRDSRSAAWEHIQETVAVQVDEAGDQQRRVPGGGGEERALIEAERLGAPSRDR
jgi:hypothetical protein